MAYSDFTLKSACDSFKLDARLDEDLFASVPGASVSPFLRTVLDEFIPLGTSIQTEKARSEFIVAPILAEVRRLMKHRVSLFSGTEFNVDSSRGLNGTCDFIMAASPMQFFVRNPVLMIVEAKNENIKGGLGQCIAEMVAAREFNATEPTAPARIHGAVTTGSDWRFLRLEGGRVFIDSTEYYVHQLESILGILLTCVGGDPATAGAAA
jgi:hypothetical protein